MAMCTGQDHKVIDSLKKHVETCFIVYLYTFLCFSFGAKKVSCRWQAQVLTCTPRKDFRIYCPGYPSCHLRWRWRWRSGTHLQFCCIWDEAREEGSLLQGHSKIKFKFIHFSDSSRFEGCLHAQWPLRAFCPNAAHPRSLARSWCQSLPLAWKALVLCLFRVRLSVLLFG